MKHTIKRLLAGGVAVICAITVQGNVVLAEQGVNSVADSKLVQNMVVKDIYEQCENKLASLTARSATRDEKVDVLYDTCELLEKAGVQSQVVASDNYEAVQTQLNVDFEELGLQPEYTYLVIEGDAMSNNPGVQPYSSTSASFSYTYNGKTYSLKYLTIKAADDPAYEKADDADLLTSTSQTLIKNCLNTAIITYISSASQVLGTVASICGLDISDFASGRSATLTLNGGANWTRVYTLVYSSADNSWMRGSCVEYVDTYSYMSGMYYSASTNRMESVARNDKRTTKFSAHYNDSDWRQRNAVIYVLNGNGCDYDTVGDVAFYYGDIKKITLRENF
ncbi:MAG: hypothetical protein NC548_56390 [Lachnospiraceae bacterium]|nr:hypothetical protein [Lachnospiraceae bacterium]MCM1235106.1 hypothetical protein [Ruminococcus flavefaciens]